MFSLSEGQNCIYAFSSRLSLKLSDDIIEDEELGCNEYEEMCGYVINN